MRQITDGVLARIEPRFAALEAKMIEDDGPGRFFVLDRIDFGLTVTIRIIFPSYASVD